MTLTELRELCDEAVDRNDALFITIGRTYLPLLIAVAEAADNLPYNANRLDRDGEAFEELEEALAALKDAK